MGMLEREEWPCEPGRRAKGGQDVEGCRQAALSKREANPTRKLRESNSYCPHTSGLLQPQSGTAEVEVVGKMCRQGFPSSFLSSSEVSGASRENLHQPQEVFTEDHAGVCRMHGPVIHEADPPEM